METISKAIEDKKEENVVKSEEVEESKGDKKKKPYVWTEKRLASFEKMRESLKNKVEVTKQLKAEKKITEKEEIKRRVREIMDKTNMNGATTSEKPPKKVKKEVVESSEESSENESSADERILKKAAEIALKKKRERKSAKKKSSSSRKVESSEEGEESEEDVQEAYESDEVRENMRKQKGFSSKKQVQQVQTSKRETGKAQRHTAYYNPLDQFILL